MLLGDNIYFSKSSEKTSHHSSLILSTDFSIGMSLLVYTVTHLIIQQIFFSCGNLTTAGNNVKITFNLSCGNIFTERYC